MKLELKHLAPYLPYGLKIDTSKLENGYSIMTMCDKGGLSNISIGDVIDEYPYTKPILRPLSDITKTIEHNGDKFVPIVEIAKLYASTNDVEAIKGAVTNFHYFKCYYGKSDYQILIINDGLRGWFSYYFNDDEPNCGVNIVNEWEVRDRLFEWHFDVFGLIDKGLAIDINSLISTVEMSTEVQNTTSSKHDAKLLVICRALFNLDNQFKPEWVRRKGFWRLLWFALLAKFGIVTTNKYSDDGCYFSIGTATPLPKLWDAGYKCSYAGEVLGEVVLFYE